jgi:hypothetical protein
MATRDALTGNNGVTGKWNFPLLSATFKNT